ncbi:MAG: metallophosphoesterase [Lachnospiraceae bacterium]|nr:metallophosphoesterase [Lachnospiraceae bacterium]
MKRRQLPILLSIALLSAVLAGCGSGGDTTDKIPGQGTESPVEPSTGLTGDDADPGQNAGTDAGADPGAGKAEDPVTDSEKTGLSAEERAQLLAGLNLTLQEVVIDVPEITKEREVIFLADTHISLCDKRDGDLMEKAAARYEEMTDPAGRGADDTFRAWMEYVSAENPDLLILGGDIIDSAMYASIDFLGEQLHTLSCPYLYLMGNHDFEYGSEYYSAKAFSEYLPRLSGLSDAREGYQILDCGDFLVFAADDYGNRYSQQAYEAFESIRDAGKPVLAVTHVPIEPLTEDTSLLEASIAAWGASPDGRSKVLLGRDGIPMDDPTVNLINSLLGEGSPVVHILAGHAHFPHSDLLEPPIDQTITGAGFEGQGVRLILK